MMTHRLTDSRLPTLLRALAQVSAVSRNLIIPSSS